MIDFRGYPQNQVCEQVRRSHCHGPAERAMAAIDEQPVDSRGANMRPAVGAHWPESGPRLRRLAIDTRRKARQQ